MTKRERVRSAIAHKTPDKVPTFFHMAPDGLNKYGESLWERRRAHSQMLVSKREV